jgi:hypothetical protein
MALNAHIKSKGWIMNAAKYILFRDNVRKSFFNRTFKCVVLIKAILIYLNLRKSLLLNR